REDRTGKKIRTAMTKLVPGAIAHRADDGLNDQTSDWTSEPEIRKRAFLGVQVLVNRAHVGELQTPAKLNAEKSETHVPDLPEAQAWFLHQRCCLSTDYTDCFYESV